MLQVLAATEKQMTEMKKMVEKTFGKKEDKKNFEVEMMCGKGELIGLSNQKYCIPHPCQWETAFEFAPLQL